MSKGRIIFLSVFFVVVIALIVVFSTVFNLKSVRVEYISNAPVLEKEYAPQDIINAGKFPYGKNVLFTDVQTISNNIETAVPYAKVQKIMRQFPNKMVVYIVERTPACKMLLPGTLNTYVVLDDSLKVLRVATEENLLETEKFVPTLTFGEGMQKDQVLALQENVKAGQTLTQTYVQPILSVITQSAYATSFTYNFIQNIEFKCENTEHYAELVLSVTDNEGAELREIRLSVRAFQDVSAVARSAFKLYNTLINQSTDFEYIDARMVDGKVKCVAYHGGAEVEAA